MDPKIKSAARLAKILARLRSKGKKIVFTNGCFDILHVGHVTYLNKAKKLGDILVVGLNNDMSVRALKGASRPINKERDRAIVLSALNAVDYITVFGEPTPDKLIRKLCPNILVKGADWKIGAIVGADFVKARGGRVVRIPFVSGYSTTAAIKAMGGRA
jgi:rfaE bifunctional protein nucleotidyltransferase chain/domain